MMKVILRQVTMPTRATSFPSSRLFLATKGLLLPPLEVCRCCVKLELRSVQWVAQDLHNEFMGLCYTSYTED